MQGQQVPGNSMASHAPNHNPVCQLYMRGESESAVLGEGMTFSRKIEGDAYLDMRVAML